MPDQFHDQDTGLGYRIVRMPTDGNCLFHCMAYALGWQDHKSIKSDLLRFLPTYIRDHDPHDRLRGDYLTCIRNVLVTEGAWGDHEHAQIFAHRHDLTVVIHPLSDTKTSAGNGDRTVHFLWRNQSHYDYLEAIPGETADRPGSAALVATRRRTQKQFEATATKGQKNNRETANTAPPPAKKKTKPKYKKGK